MPQLKNLKNEAFCQELVRTKGNLTKAYANTYNSSSNLVANSKASRLFKDIRVKDRIEELFNRANLSLDKVIVEHSSLINSKVYKVTANDKLQAIGLYYKINQLVSNGTSSPTLNQQINIGTSTSERTTLRLILGEITALNEALKLKESVNDSDNVLDNSDGE